ncbi:winged helix-turn-helix transcriptional regulator [Geovibrio ferrireducens]|jgi:DNA-binding HxlR family transcriptional regulator|uniref:winged helix-turn-helix transcriptional regulator n=1 Tax=Geovibrio ferrireducens TaxID=46201 RepID=UPI002246DFE9|nr:helix-turn-helix domain-containing protein [Geovibrio ferrireducens]
MFVFNFKEFECPFNCFAEIIKGKWRTGIILSLSGSPKRFSELKKELAGVSSKVLADNLRALESGGLLSRTVFPTVPPAVEYSLTEQGQELSGIMDSINNWAGIFLNKGEAVTYTE